MYGMGNPWMMRYRTVNLGGRSLGQASPRVDEIWVSNGLVAVPVDPSHIPAWRTCKDKVEALAPAYEPDTPQGQEAIACINMLLRSMGLPGAVTGGDSGGGGGGGGAAPVQPPAGGGGGGGGVPPASTPTVPTYPGSGVPGGGPGSGGIYSGSTPPPTVSEQPSYESGPPVLPPKQNYTMPAMPTGAYPGSPFQAAQQPMKAIAPMPRPEACPLGPVPVADWANRCALARLDSGS